MFEFTIPWDDVADTVTNMSFLNEEIINDVFVNVQNGHFGYNGKRIRFFGGNLGMAACFPKPEVSEIAAQRLAKLGCNLVRLTHMDWRYSPEGIWKDIGDGSKRTMDTEQLKKLDYFIYQLKEHGIFVNLNLHVTRELTAADGIVHDDNMPPFNKGVDIFDATMRERHKEYATQLLTHVNQFTELAYYDDPVIAMVEVTNEDSLLVVWQHRVEGDGEIDRLGDFYQNELNDLWEAWWMAHYPSRPPDRPTRNAVANGECDPDLAMNYIDFLLSLEENYHQDMVDHLKNIAEPGVGVQVPISGTQPGTLDGTYLSSTFHDSHACYACWNSNHQFFVDSITKYPFKDGHMPIPYISGGKVTGKPHVATELSSPWPNYHAAEPILLSTMYGAFQDWDGLLVFAYRGDGIWNRNYVAVKYDFDRHMTKLAAITVASLLFRRNDIRTGEELLRLVTTRQNVLEHAWGNPNMAFSFVTHWLGHRSPYSTLLRRIEIDKGGEQIIPEEPEEPEDHIYRALINEEEGHELEWHYDEDNRDDSFFKADTENVHVLAGAIDSDHVEIHNFYRGVLAGGSIEVLSPLEEDSALIAVILVESTPERNTYLIIATGKMENDEFDPTEVIPPETPRMYYLDEPEDWGDDPVWVEGIGARITLPVSAIRVDCYTLNPDGSEHMGFEPEPSGNHCIVHLSPDNQTLWYKIVIHQVG